MKSVFKTSFLILCLISLANCRRGGGGPMDGGGGPMGGAGPCPRCNKNREANNDALRRDRINPFDQAPFPRAKDPNNLDIGGGLGGIGDPSVEGQSSESRDTRVINPSTSHDGTSPLRMPLATE